MANILIIGNYPADRQYSMQRYTRWLARTIEAGGHRVKLIEPQRIIGRLSGSSAAAIKWLGYLDKFVLFPALVMLRGDQSSDIVHIADQANAPYQALFDRRRIVVTCHDLIAVKSALGLAGIPPTRWSGRILQRWILASLRKVRTICCVSQKTADDLALLVRTADRDVSIIHNPVIGYSPMPAAEADRLIAEAGLAIDRPFLLHVGNNHWYKNRRGAVEIFCNLADRPGFERLGLVLAGPPPAAALTAFVAEQPARSRIIQALDPPDRLMAALYSRADALLFPSLEEGFGWPIVEAQACGCPVITSRREPMTTVGGASAFFIDPAEPETAAKSIAENWRWIRNQTEASRTNAARFAESRAAEDYLLLYDRILKSQALSVPEGSAA